MNWSRIRGVYFRNLYNLVKGPFQLSDLFFWPLVDILLWGLTSVWIQTQNAQIPDLALMLLTGLVLWQVTMRGSVDVSVGILQEFWHRNLVNLFSTPLKISEWSVGVILLNLCKLVVTLAFGSLLVYFLYALNVFALGWMFLPFAASLLLFGIAIGFIAASGIIYWGHQVEVFAFMMAFFFAPFCAVFYPVAFLPHWAQMVAWCLPPTYVFEGMRQIILTGSFPQSYFWISIGLNIVFLIGTTSLFRIMFEKSRNKGLGRFE